MNDLIIQAARISAMTPATIAKIRTLEAEVKKLPQADLETHHLIHGGMYSRTITVNAGSVLVGALINVPTILIVSGDVTVAVDDGILHLTGYNVIPASAGRKQAFTAHSDTMLTMIFSTDARDVETAENEFTDEADKLMSRAADAVNVITITEDT